MIFILCENTIDSICSEMDKFYARYPESARVKITKEFFKENTSAYSQPPLTAERWLFICSGMYVKKNLTVLNTLAEKNVVLITCTTLAAGQEILEYYSEAENKPRIIDNTDPGEVKLIQYVMKELGTNQEIARYLCKRCGFYMPKIIRAVRTLSIKDSISRVDIRKYVPAGLQYNVYDLANWMIGNRRKYMTYEDAIGVVYEYRFGYKYLFKYLSDFFSAYLVVFKAVSNAELTEENVHSFVSNSKDKSIKALSEKRVQVMVSTFSTISVDKLFFIQYHLAKINSNRFELYKLVALLKTLK